MNLIRSFLLLFTLYGLAALSGADPVYAAACTNAYIKDTAIPSGYGAAYNFFFSAEELLIQGADCRPSTYSIQLGSGNSSGSGVQAKRAYDFVDAIGVCGHMDSPDYNGVEIVPKLQARLSELGVRYFRGAYGGNTRQNNVIKSFYNALGIRFIFGTGRMFGDLSAQEGVNAVDGALSQVPTNMILAFEGANEYNNNTNKRRYGADTVTEKIKAHQSAMYNAVKTNTSGVTVIGPSFIQIHNNYHDTMSVGDLSHIANFATAHSYSNNRSPEMVSRDHWNLLFKHSFPAGVPIYVTEFGFCNWLPEARCITESAAAKLAVRYFATLFQHNPNNKGFIYEFIDKGRNDGEGTFGIVKRDTNLTPKPIFFALRNTIRILNETDNSYTPGNLNYTLDGKTATVHEMLLQKKDGKFYLFVWDAPDVDYKDYTSPTRTNVTLVLPNTANVRIFEPSDPNNNIESRDQPLQTLTNTVATTLAVSDHIVMVEIDNIK